jgi:hypothetical protein
MKMDAADVVVGIFWQRFGTPTHASGSGTEHELRRAWSSWRDSGRPEVMLYFCERKSRCKSAAEAGQLHRLLTFREGLPREQFWCAYTKPVEFERAVRQHLVAYLITPETATADDLPELTPRERRVLVELCREQFGTGRMVATPTNSQIAARLHPPISTASVSELLFRMYAK